MNDIEWILLGGFIFSVLCVGAAVFVITNANVEGTLKSAAANPALAQAAMA